MSSRIKEYLTRAWKTALFPAIVFLFFGIATGGRIFTARSIVVILRQSVLPAIIIMAMMPNLSLGMMDFSIGAVVMTSAIFAGNLMNMTNTGYVGLIVFSLIVAVALTSFTGFLNNKLRVPLLVVSLGLALVYEALPMLAFPKTQTAIINVKYAALAQIPSILVVLAVAFVIYYILTNKTVYGHNIRALGGNSELATRAGLKVNQITQLSFTISGVFAGIAAVVYICSNGQVNAPSAFSSLGTVMNAFLGLFLGMFLSRFCDASLSIIISVITMTTLLNGLLMLGVSSTSRNIFSSAVLLVLLALSSNQPYFTRWINNNKRAKLANQAYSKVNNN